MINIAILASGIGTNAKRIIEKFQSNNHITADCIITNRENAGVIKIAKQAEIPHFYFSNESFKLGLEPLEFLKERNIKWIVLAGFLRKIPISIINSYTDRIINIHPALLPKFGGKGMYGMKVHEAVLKAKEKESGISIHFVNENFDKGEIISQKTCLVNEFDTPESLSKKVQVLEHQYFPRVIEDLILAELTESTDLPT